jgi:hypothetical protein
MNEIAETANLPLVLNAEGKPASTMPVIAFGAAALITMLGWIALLVWIAILVFF